MSAPSFSSFPPSFSSFPDDDAGPSKLSAADSSKSGRKEEKRHKKDRDGHERKEKKRRKEKDELRKPHTESYGAERTQDEEPTRYFFSDKRGDQLNLQYGGLHQGDVPKYKTVSRGYKILGAPSLSVLSRTTHTVEVGIKGRHLGPSLTDSKARSLLAAPPTRRLLAADTRPTEVGDEDIGFIRLTSRRTKPGIDESYRSITKDPSNSDTEASASDAEDDDEDSSDDDAAITLTSHQEAVKALEQEITYDPSSVSNWLKRITLALAEIPMTSKYARRLRAEATITVVERAFTVDPKNRSSIALQLKYLRAGEELFTREELGGKWETAYQIGGIQIWMEWMDWKLRSEGIECTVDAAIRVLNSLGDDEEKEVAKLRVLWRSATAFRQAGFVERANAIFQAQAELSFEVPQALYGLPLTRQLDELEEFWDAEVPRMGEADSQGWAAWVSSGKKDSEPVDAPSLSLPTCPDRYRQWAIQELHADTKSFLPSKAVNESDNDEWDPYANILFTDIRPFLLSLQTPLAKNVFRLSWLSFSGLHIPGFEDSYLTVDAARDCWDDRWSFTYITSPTQLGSLFPPKESRKALTTEAASGVIIGRERQFSSGPISIKSWGYGVFNHMDSTLQGEGLWGKLDVADVDHAFVRRIFGQLRLGSDDCEWDALSLAFEGAINVKSALKLSRTYLSEARNSLPHWAAHARLERRRAKLDEARKIYTTVLSAAPSPDQPWAGRLWWDWAEMEWLAGQITSARSAILKSVGLEGSTGIVILRAKRTLEEHYRRRDIEWKDREAWLKLRALLEVSTSGDITQALMVFDTYHVGGVAKESLSVAILLFVYNFGVVLKNPMPPSVLRERAARALRMYPSNSVILELFLESEKGQGVWGRVRESLREQDGVEKDLSRRLQEVWIGKWQVGRWESEVERTRSGLAAAVDSERTRGSAILWRVYIEFELRAGQLKRAKELLFRAILECPAAKELYLLAFDSLRSEFTNEQLDTLMATMVERGLRLRKDFDVDVVMEEVPAVVGDESDSDSEIEENARELRRLMPY